MESWGENWGGNRTYQEGKNSGSVSYGSNWSRSKNFTQVQREILKPEEVLALNPRTALTFIDGMSIMTNLIRYDEEPTVGKEVAKKRRLLKVKERDLVIVLSLIALFLTAGAITVRPIARIEAFVHSLQNGGQRWNLNRFKSQPKSQFRR